MMNFLVANWDSVLVVVVVAIGLVVLVRKGASKQVYQILFYLVSEAEAQFGNGTGVLKYSAVTTWLYESLPTIVTILFTAKQIDEMIENAVQDMKKYLDENSQARVLIINK